MRTSSVLGLSLEENLYLLKLGILEGLEYPDVNLEEDGVASTWLTW